MSKRCITTNSKIEDLHAQLSGETIESIKGLVELWQDRNNTDWDTYPTASELASFREELRGGEDQIEKVLGSTLSSTFSTQALSTIEEQAKVELDFDPIIRRDRVNLIARFFSREVDLILQEKDHNINKRIEEAEKESNVIAIEELSQELNSLDRFRAISSVTPAGVFLRVRDIFSRYISDTEDNRIQAELSRINNQKGSERYSDSQKYEAAKKRALYKTDAYTRIVDNFKPLAEEASSILAITEGLRIDLNSVSPSNATLTESLPEGDSISKRYTDELFREEVYREGWMSNFREVSSRESLSQEVRKAIREIPRLDYNGKRALDDLGFPKYLEADYVHAVLIDKLKDMIDSSDLMPLLEDLRSTKPQVGQIIHKLQGDERLFSQFYQNFRKDFTPYWIQKRQLQSDGTFKMKTISVNKPEGVYYLLEQWRDNYEMGDPIDEDSIYGSDREISKENVRKGLELTEDLNNRFTNLSTEQRLNLLEDPLVWKTVNKLLNMVGIDTNPAVLKSALTNIKQSEIGEITDPIMQLLYQLNVLFSGITSGKVKIETPVDGVDKKADLINAFGTVYINIAKMLSDVTDDAIESSFRENDKSYFSHTNPNYIGKLIKLLKNVRRDEKSFKEFIDTEYRQYDWFFKDGRWRNGWLKELVENPKMREALQHKVVLNHDKIEYQDLGELDYTIELLVEYFADPENTDANIKFANYHLPILSDSPSGEFIRFLKYDNHSVIGEDGEYRRYDDIILDHMVDLVNQEVDRIALVNQRDIKYQKGDPEVEPIANFDIVRKKDGSIRSIGGAEFKFLPALNLIRYENGDTFLQRLQKIQREGTGEDLEEFIKGAVRESIDSEFEETYKEWDRIGLFSENNDGKYIFLNVLGVSTGQSQYNKVIAGALHRAKNILGDSWTQEMDRLLGLLNNNKPIDNREAVRILDDIRNLIDYRVTQGTIPVQEAKSIDKDLVIRNSAKDKLREYFWNSKYATSQIIQLTTTDLAFYKDLEDFQKRFKEVHAPSLRLNTNSKYGRKVERVIYLQDNEIVSPNLSDIETILDDRVRKNEMSKRDRDLILNKFREVNVADAQAYRSLSSYRAILDMAGQWTDDMQKAFDNFQSGKWDISDFNVIWQTKKPYLYTQTGNISGIDGYTKIKTPVQHKNSEFLLLAAFNMISASTGRSEKLRAINDFMEKYGIDVVQFESAVKVGKQGLISLNEVDSYKGVTDILTIATGVNNIENPNFIHTLSYEDYGIQTETPEHMLDTTQLVGTQIRKLITADIAEGTNIEVDGKLLNKDEWMSLYDSIIVENTLQSYLDIRKIFSDPKDLEKILLDEIRGDQNYGIDQVRSFTLNNQGEFNIPLSEPSHSLKTQELLNSIIKGGYGKNGGITKQKIKGGALIQVSSFGLTDDLHIVYEGEGDKKRIKYMECYMPAYSREFYEPLMDPKTHQLDITKLPEDLRRLIGYRVPTEDKYSMAPLYIKGFLPQQNGSAIMLPAEITTISGSDFDVDKMYIMLPEFKITPKYNRKQFVEDLISQLTKGRALTEEEFKSYRDTVQQAITQGKSSPKGSDEYNIWKTYMLNREQYRVRGGDIIEKIHYDWNKTPADNSLEARNNLLIDMMWGILTNADTASKVLNPGSFDYQKKAARIVTILQSSREEELRKELNIPKDKSVYSALSNMDLNTQLDPLALKFKRKLDPLSPRTQVILHQQNMTGAALIGIYANHNANHALMQHTMLGLDEENGAFTLDGKSFTSLHNVINDNKEYISKNNAGFLAASVDNAKDPVLAALNQNTFTANASMLLSRLGYNPIVIGLLMQQPIVVDITKSYMINSRLGKSSSTIMKEVIDEYREKASMMEDVTYDNYKSNKFLLEDLADNILIEKGVYELSDRAQTSDYRKISFYRGQVAVGSLFSRIMSSSDALNQLVQATRADTGNGAAGPSIADTTIKLQRVEDFISNVVEASKSPLTGADVISDEDISGRSEEEIRDFLLNSKLPYLQAFYTLGIKETTSMLNRYFPQFSKPFRDVIEGNDEFKGLRYYTKTGKLDSRTLNNIYNDLFAYIMSGTEFFGAESLGDQYVNSEDRRDQFINRFPEYFNKVVGANPNIADLEFIKRLKVIKANEQSPVDVLVFKNVGSLSPILKERYSRDWASLLYMGPEAQQLALNLFRYSFYRNGFAFGPNTFIHLAPVVVLQNIPGYIETLRELTIREDDYRQFIDQYIYNHLNNRKFVPEIPSTASTQFVGRDNNILDRVIFTIDTESNSNDRKIIRNTIGFGEEQVYDFFDYIARNHNGNMVYYRLTQSDTTLPNVAIYERISPLGFKNNFIEYQYGVDVEDMRSVIKQNDKDYSPDPLVDSSSIELDDTNVEDALSYSEADFTSLSELPEQDAIREAFETVYKSPLNINDGKTDDILSITPNTEFRDANNDKICGAITK